MNFSSNHSNNQALPSPIVQQRRSEEGRISVGQPAQAQTDTSSPTGTTQNLKTCTGLNDMKAGIESLKIGGSSSAPTSATVGPKKGYDDGLNDTRKLLGQASTGSKSETNESTPAIEQNKAQVFEKLDAFYQEVKTGEASKQAPPEAEVSLALNDVTSTSEAVPAHNNADEPRSTHRISFSRVDDVMSSDDDDEKSMTLTAVPAHNNADEPRSTHRISFSRVDDVMSSDDDDDDDEKSMTLDDLVVSARDRASSTPEAPTSVPDLILSSQENTDTAANMDCELFIEAPLHEEGRSSRRSSAISFECHDTVLLDLLSQEISDDEDDIDPRRNPSFYNESLGGPNVLSRMDQSILNREVSNGRLVQEGHRFSFSIERVGP
eukprot:CAMPEP_0185825504 /NCGR_PEP_ID=MMETSP1322-20130828/31082_1 /TAXON_ID=265543 /ORGANISM="Minutocellus polymorphus, Strain RCC2270" /LENGTH=377 /DNA_ID=CAMNT_0028523229 /DNA_START=51 /DNA_END=1185 /DNA_ORIENTATION=-